MEAKFKVGDKVRVVNSITSISEKYSGRELEVKRVIKGIETPFLYYLGEVTVYEKEIELIKQPHKEEIGSFMVFVEGRSFPKVKHTLADAHEEAKRLCLKEKRRAHIISTFGCYELSAEFKSEI